ncbi:unnamed protein product [Medioppia subpectinata]|uniref:Muskelin N-terminal domain-containing protein n=1 Tax=Medioppia subpectinata TaxID=1979941 RepID=A0A7R9PZ41_9ACAR|nr:unnamed protein product [Medioppia subpectinata]CAG2105822.1 unnamed protein product [Medioppia subpectinata]
MVIARRPMAGHVNIVTERGNDCRVGDQQMDKCLSYTIHQVSSYSPNYPPNRILEDNPNDSNSRWSSESTSPPQYMTLKLSRTAIVTEILFGKHRKPHLCNVKRIKYMTLKLSRTAIVTEILFGKHRKPHLCNVKRIKVFGGMTEESMIELLDDILANDGTPETFTLKHRIVSNEFPCRYVRIQPLQTWSRAHHKPYNFSLWFVELKGRDDPSLVKDCLHWFDEYRQREAIRLCLKLNAVFLTSLRKLINLLVNDCAEVVHLVIDGDYDSVEELLEEVCEKRLFDAYIRRQDYRPVWRRLIPGAKSVRPGMRGGHQMCIDSLSQLIYLFGGWDGTQDLADLWSYDIAGHEWTRISKDTFIEGGPSARSCHKMCLDPIRKKIYTLGRYLDSSIRSIDNLKSDFYIYDIQTNRWTLVCADTASMGGPALVFDHQMCMDLEKNSIYVFGGRVLSSSDERMAANCPEQPLFSGLYQYDANTGQWRKLRDDCSAAAGVLTGGHREIKSRIGHSMLFHQKLRLLYVFAGQRQKEYLSDFFTYNVDTDEISVINDGHKSEVPAAGFTQRATIDPESHEIHVLSGLNRDKDRDRDKDKDSDRDKSANEESVKNSFWVYDILDSRWSCIYRNHNSIHVNKIIANNITNTTSGDCDLTTGNTSTAIAGTTDTANDGLSGAAQPCPRFAHQLVYDHINKCHYLFGGNPGRNQNPKLRLDDFWTLELKRLSGKELLRLCKRLVREQAFREMIDRNGSKAIQYLQNQLSQTFNHSDPEESRLFQSLATLIFRTNEWSPQPRMCPEMGSATVAVEPDLNYKNRTKVFDTIVEYFPEHMTQPKANLVDLVLI